MHKDEDRDEEDKSPRRLLLSWLPRSVTVVELCIMLAIVALVGFTAGVMFQGYVEGVVVREVQRRMQEIPRKFQEILEAEIDEKLGKTDPVNFGQEDDAGTYPDVDMISP